MKRLYLALFLLPLVNGSCPDGFALIKDGECRMITPQRIKMQDNQATDSAISQCAETKTQPLIIHNEEQQAYWTDKFNERCCWWIALGIVCNATSQTYQWADGSAVDYKPKKFDPALNGVCSSGCIWQLWNSDGDWGIRCDTTLNTWDFYCTLQLQPPVPSADGCDGFGDDSEDGVCYQVIDAADDFQGAQMLCKQLGANENTFIRRLAVSRGAVDGVYLGASVSGKGYDFAWIDGTNWDYENFHPGFPKAGYGDCLAMDTSVSTGLWMNINCSEDLPVACIRDQKEVVDPTCSNETWKEQQIITSPGYPFNASTFCDYFLTVDAGKKVEAVIELEANSCCDYLTIYDGYLGGNLIANLTGNIRSKVIKTTTSNIMRVNWVPNGAVNVRGLVMTFRGVLH